MNERTYTRQQVLKEIRLSTCTKHGKGTLSAVPTGQRFLLRCVMCQREEDE